MMRHQSEFCKLIFVSVFIIYCTYRIYKYNKNSVIYKGVLTPKLSFLPVTVGSPAVPNVEIFTSLH